MAIVQSVRPRELKELFLLGPRMPLDQETKRILASNKDVLIIGDGENPIDPADIKKMLQEKNYKIGPNTRIDIDAHGNRRQDGQHIMSLFKNMELSKDIFRTLKEISSANNPLYVHLWSCYGGSANKSVGELGNGSILVTHIEAKESSGITLGDLVINDSLKRYLDPKNHNLTPHQQFILDLPKNYEAAAFNQATAEGNKKFKFTRIPKEKYMGDVLEKIDRHQTLQGFVNNFFAEEGARFQKDFPNARVSDAIEQISHLNDQEAKSYAQGILVHSFMTTGQNRSADSMKQFVEKLQNKGLDINNTPDNNMNALHWAAYKGNANNIKMLLEHGADPNKLDKFGINSLGTALSYGHNGCAKVLVNSDKLIINDTIIARSVARLVNFQVKNFASEQRGESVDYNKKRNVADYVLLETVLRALEERPYIDRKRLLLEIIDNDHLVKDMAYKIVHNSNSQQEEQNLIENFSQQIKSLVINENKVPSKESNKKQHDKNFAKVNTSSLVSTVIEQSIKELEKKGAIVDIPTRKKINEKLKPALLQFPNEYLNKHSGELAKNVSESLYKEKTILSNLRSRFKISSKNLDKIVEKLHLQAQAKQIAQKATSHVITTTPAKHHNSPTPSSNKPKQEPKVYRF